MSTFDTLAGPPSPPTQPKKEPHPIRGLKSGETIDVLPYTGYSKESDLFLPWMWRRFKEDGLIELYFPGMSDTGFPAFVSLMSGGAGIQVVLVVVKDAEGKIIDLMGIATWEQMRMGEATLAHCGFIFLTEYWDHRTSLEAARRIMRLWFDEVKLDTLIGIVAEDNHLAMRFMQRVGWRLAGTLQKLHVYKGKPSNAALWEMTRESFEKGAS